MNNHGTETEEQRCLQSALNDLLSVSVGLHKDRMKSDLSDVERTFVREWQAINEESGITTQILECLFQIHCDREDPGCLDYFSASNFSKHTELGAPNDRDRIVAETVIQWLGTNVGRGFLHSCGFTR